jgi:hypothetical protein
MEMTPAKAAFISGKPVEAAKEAIRIVPEKAKLEPIEVPNDGDGEESPKAAPAQRKRKGEGTSIDAHNSFVGELLVSLTTRIQPRTANALRRAHLEQELRHAKPDTQQDIIEEALAAWLTRHGYLE